MNPLVDEYNSKTGNRGTELNALKVAEGETQSFAFKCFVVTGVVFAIESFVRFTQYGK